MPSLRSAIRAGRIWVADEWREPSVLDEVYRLFGSLVATLKQHTTISVNAQSVWADMRPSGPGDDLAWCKALTFWDVPRPMPCFENMWIEASDLDKSGTIQRFGVLINRQEASSPAGPAIKEMEELLGDRLNGAKWRCPCISVFEKEGSAVIAGTICIWLDESGEFLESCRQYIKFGPNDAYEQQNLLVAKLRTAWVLHTLARLNCKNVELRLLDEVKSTQHSPKRPLLASFWHEIRINESLKIRTAGRAVIKDIADPKNQRAHWVRGHYADYRKSGLFGQSSLKAVFWIPEHRVGNEEIGQIVPEYRLSS